MDEGTVTFLHTKIGEHTLETEKQRNPDEWKCRGGERMSTSSQATDNEGREG